MLVTINFPLTSKKTQVALLSLVLSPENELANKQLN